jgi:hypothetical protein
VLTKTEDETSISGTTGVHGVCSPWGVHTPARMRKQVTAQIRLAYTLQQPLVRYSFAKRISKS